MSSLHPLLEWTPDQLTDGLAQLGVAAAAADSPGRPATIEAALSHIMAANPQGSIGLTSEFEHLAECLAGSAPMLLKVYDAEIALLLVRASRRRAVLASRDGSHHTVAVSTLIALLETPLPDAVADTIEHLEEQLGTHNFKLGEAFRREHHRARPLFVGWALRTPAPQKLSQELRRRPLVARASALAGIHFFHFGAWIASWIALASALLGVGDRGDLLTLWVLALASSMLALPVESLLQQSLTTRIGVVIKQHLLRAALAMDEAAVRSLGIGALIARALEANNLDALASKGAIKVLLTAFDFSIVCAAFYWFAGFHPLLALFVSIAALSALVSAAYWRAEQRLHAANLAVTAVHTEEMIGHRTRKAFLGRNAWHSEEDHVLAAYERASAATDRTGLVLGSIPRFWAVGAVSVVLINLFGQATATSTLMSVVLIGFVIIGFATLQNAAAGIMQLIKALVSFAYLDTARQQAVRGATGAAPGVPRESAGGAQLIVKGLHFTYPGAARPTVRDADLWLPPGAKVVLSGTSGSGKSTLGTLLAGRLEPDAGAVLSHGVDRHVVGPSGWHRYVCYVPQFSNNHVLTDTFAFNLLLGRSWPPAPEDLREAREVAASLGLEQLIDKMPAGIMQMVGEGGWHLSQGERSRLFVARGILQGAHVLIADELLSPLDPATGLNVLNALERLPSQLLLIAHS